MRHKKHLAERFTGYSVDDCDCKLCLYYAGKKRGCKVKECICAEELEQAHAQEQLTPKAVNNVKS